MSDIIPGPSSEKLSLPEQEPPDVVFPTVEDTLKRLRDFIQDTEEERAEGKERPDDLEIQESKKIIEDFIAAGEYPRVTVPIEFLDDIMKNGLKRRETFYQKGVKAIIGTIGVHPFLPPTEKRAILELTIDDPEKIGPRFTGPNKVFQGVVEIKMLKVPPGLINVIRGLEEVA